MPDHLRGEWTAVTLTRARQVAVMMGVEEDALPPPDLGVRERFDALRDDGDIAGATAYLAHALPRFEAVGWAARLLHAESLTRELRPRDRLALDNALRWLGDPSDGNRRATRAAADAAGKRSAERMLGLAVFYSGGSIAPPQGVPVFPPPQSCGHWCAGAIALAAYRTDAPAELFTRALALGEAVAERGARALSGAGAVA